MSDNSDIKKKVLETAYSSRNQSDYIFNIVIKDLQNLFPGNRLFIGFPTIVIGTECDGRIRNFKLIGQDTFGRHRHIDNIGTPDPEHV